MSHQELLHVIGQVSQRVHHGNDRIVRGVIASYNAQEGTVVVKLMPHNVLTGDMQFLTPWAGTPGTTSGFQAGPEPGLQVIVLALDAAWQDCVCMPSVFSDVNHPPGAPAGEAWLLHKSGSSVKLTNAGDVDMAGNTAVRLNAALVQLSNSFNSLGDGNSVVRKSDLQTVITAINAFVSAFNSHTHLGNLGGPTSSPIIPTSSLGAATASSIVQAG